MGLIGATKRLAVVCRASYFRPGGRCQAVLLTISLASTFLMTAIPQAVADERPPISQLSSSSHHHALEKHAGQSDTDQASTLSGTLVDSLGNKLPGANVEVVPAGSSGCGSPVIASTQTGADGSFSLSVSPGTYNILISFYADATDPQFALCTANVDLAASVNDTLTVPITQLTVIAQDAAGHPVQGAIIEPGGTGTATFDLFPGDPVTNGNMESIGATTGPAGTAVIPFIPLAQSITMSVQPPADSGLAPTTVSTGLLATDTTVTATFAASVTLSGTLVDSLGNKLPGANVEVVPAGSSGCGSPVIASTQTGADGSFSLSVSPGTYNILISFYADATDPQFALCTANVDLAASVNDTLTVPITQLTVIAQDAAGHPVQGAIIEPGGTGTATFDLFPGDPVTNGNMESIGATTGPAGTAVIPFIPLAQSITMSVQPPADSGLAPTTVSTGLLATDTTVTATLAEKSGPPPPPTDVMAKPGNGRAIVSWTAPTLQTGSVTGYTATASPGSQSCTTTGGTTCTITGLTNGTPYTVTVIAHTTIGDSEPSAPATVTPQAQKSASSTSITSTTASPVVGQPITTTVQVAGQSTGAGDLTPTGTVTVSDGTRSCQAPLSGSNGVATGSCQITEQSPGSYSFTASYPGDASFAASTTSSPATVTVGQQSSSTSITSTTASPVVGQPITITVQVVGQLTGAGDLTPTGTVTVSDGTRSCQAALSGSNGVVSGSCQITEQSPGSYSFTASYPGDADFTASHASAVTVVVAARAKSSTTLALSAASVTYGNEKSLSLAVAVASQSTGTPTGAVIITAGRIRLCTVKLSSGTGTCSPRSDTVLSAGKATLVATYTGSADFRRSSAHATLRVTKAKTYTSLTLSPASVVYGKERSLKVSVTVMPQYSGAPRGVVIIAVGQTTLCTIKLNSRTGSCSPSSQKTMSRGKHVIVASYQGSADFSQSSTSKTLTVRKA